MYCQCKVCNGSTGDGDLKLTMAVLEKENADKRYSVKHVKSMYV